MATNKTKEQIINLLKSKGITNLHGGIQLFADQYDKDWSISVNYSGTGIHIPKKDIDLQDLYEDDDVKICKTWTYKEKEN